MARNQEALEDFQTTINCWLKKKASHILVSHTCFDRKKTVSTSIFVVFASLLPVFILEFSSLHIQSIRVEGFHKTFEPLDLKKKKNLKTNINLAIFLEYTLRTETAIDLSN